VKETLPQGSISLHKAQVSNGSLTGLSGHTICYHCGNHGTNKYFFS